MESVIKLIDFGLSARKKPNKKLEEYAGTLDYIAPESLQNIKFKKN